MEMRREQEPRDMSEDDLVKLIRKLRWAGMEQEAESMQSQLMLRRLPAADSVCALPRETD